MVLIDVEQETAHLHARYGRQRLSLNHIGRDLWPEIAEAFLRNPPREHRVDRRIDDLCVR
jgi:hypothetical protein